MKPWYSGPYEAVYIYGVEAATNKHKRKKCYVHRLVAEHFLKEKKGKKFVHHKNGKEQDNAVGNLEWTTMEDNLKARKFFYKDDQGTVKRKKRAKKKVAKEQRNVALPR